MKKYSVSFKLYASTSVIVEADSEDQAREIAESNFEYPILCHHCSNEVDLSDDAEIVDITEV